MVHMEVEKLIEVVREDRTAQQQALKQIREYDYWKTSSPKLRRRMECAAMVGRMLARFADGKSFGAHMRDASHDAFWHDGEIVAMDQVSLERSGLLNLTFGNKANLDDETSVNSDADYSDEASLRSTSRSSSPQPTITTKKDEYAIVRARAFKTRSQLMGVLNAAGYDLADPWKVMIHPFHSQSRPYRWITSGYKFPAIKFTDWTPAEHTACQTAIQVGRIKAKLTTRQGANKIRNGRDSSRGVEYREEDRTQKADKDPYNSKKGQETKKGLGLRATTQDDSASDASTQRTRTSSSIAPSEVIVSPAPKRKATADPSLIKRPRIHALVKQPRIHEPSSPSPTVSSSSVNQLCGAKLTSTATPVAAAARTSHVLQEALQRQGTAATTHSSAAVLSTPSPSQTSSQAEEALPQAISPSLTTTQSPPPTESESFNGIYIGIPKPPPNHHSQALAHRVLARFQFNGDLHFTVSSRTAAGLPHEQLPHREEGPRVGTSLELRDVSRRFKYRYADRMEVLRQIFLASQRKRLLPLGWRDWEDHREQIEWRWNMRCEALDAQEKAALEAEELAVVAAAVADEGQEVGQRGEREYTAHET